MSFPRLSFRSLCLALPAACLGFSGAGAGEADAALLFHAAEVGSDVVITGSGTANLSAFGDPNHTSDQRGNVVPGYSAVIVGPVTKTSTKVYFGLTASPAFGTGSTEINAPAGTGQHFGVYYDRLLVPAGYQSGESLAGTMTFTNKTFASLGLVPGTYTWTWGSGASADSATFQIGGALPEPASFALLAVAAPLVLRRRR